MPLENAIAVDPTLALWLKILSGVCWTIAYILIIRRGFTDKTYGMPVVALCANVSWEFIFSFVHPHSKPQLYIDYVWLFFDLGILVQYLKFGKSEFQKAVPLNLFYPAFLITLSLAFAGVLMISYEFGDLNGIYAAFIQNFMMSVLFVFMLLKRGNSEGQSIYIALLKMMGTIFPSLLFYNHYPNSYLLTYLYLAIGIFDFLYFLMLYKKLLQEGKNPWKHA